MEKWSIEEQDMAQTVKRTFDASVIALDSALALQTTRYSHDQTPEISQKQMQATLRTTEPYYCG